MLLLLVTGVQVARAQGGDILRGAQIYDANCAVCHGADGQGRVGVNLSQDFPAIDLAAFVRQAVVAGVPGTRM
ncbi:MAG: c-type cytochrome, partial [Anaerolineae bacterium]|nr:c-type cytochrome [Anaerolineae bacterium]